MSALSEAASQSVVGQVNGPSGNRDEHVANSRLPRGRLADPAETIPVRNNDKFEAVRFPQLRANVDSKSDVCYHHY